MALKELYFEFYFRNLVILTKEDTSDSELAKQSPLVFLFYKLSIVVCTEKISALTVVGIREI